MPLPGNWTTVTVTHQHTAVGGVPMRGTVTWKSSGPVTDPSAGMTIPPSSHRVELDGTGGWSVTVPVVDDPDTVPTGWHYVVTLDLVEPSGRRVLSTHLVQVTGSMAPSVDWSALVEVSPVGEVSAYARLVDIDALAARNRLVVDFARMTGVDPTGVAACDAALDAVLASATEPLTILFTSGTYRLDAAHTIDPSLISLQGGDGQQVVLDCTRVAAGPAFTVRKASAGPVDRRVRPFADLTVQGPTGATTVDGFLLGGTGYCNSTQWDRVRITGFRDQVIFGDSCYLNEWHHCHFYDAKRNAVSAPERDDANENQHFLFCVFDANDGASVYCNDAGATLHFTSCSFDYSQADLDLRAGLVLMTDCYIEANDAATTATERIKLTPSVDSMGPTLKIKGGSIWPFYTSGGTTQTVIRITGNTAAIRSNAVVSLDGVFIRTDPAQTVRYLIYDDRTPYAAASGLANVERRSRVSVRDLTYKDTGGAYSYSPLVYRDVDGIEWRLDGGVDYGQVGDPRGTRSAADWLRAHVIETIPRTQAITRQLLTSGDLYVMALPRTQPMFRASVIEMMCAMSTQGSSITTAQLALYDGGRNYETAAAWGRMARGFFTANTGSESIRTSSITTTVGMGANNEVYAAVLVTSTGTMPYLYGRLLDTGTNPLIDPQLAGWPRVVGKLTGQTDMPASIDPALLVKVGFQPWLAVRPTTYA